MAKPFNYAAKNESSVFESVLKNKGNKITNQLLMRIYVGISEETGNLYKVVSNG